MYVRVGGGGGLCHLSLDKCSAVGGAGGKGGEGQPEWCCSSNEIIYLWKPTPRARPRAYISSPRASGGSAPGPLTFHLFPSPTPPSPTTPTGSIFFVHPLLSFTVPPLLPPPFALGPCLLQPLLHLPLKPPFTSFYCPLSRLSFIISLLSFTLFLSLYLSRSGLFLLAISHHLWVAFLSRSLKSIFCLTLSSSFNLGFVFYTPRLICFIPLSSFPFSANVKHACYRTGAWQAGRGGAICSGSPDRIIQMHWWTRDIVTNLCQLHATASPIMLAVCQEWGVSQWVGEDGCYSEWRGSCWPLWQDKTLRVLKVWACTAINRFLGFTDHA